jgi:Bacterial aa3 type cytochrome c oxidase subunit IV
MAQGGAHGHMDIQDQRETFSGFLHATLWTCALIAQGIALSTVAFAMGYGWWSGMLAFVAIGVAVALLFRMSGAFWAVQIALWVVLAIGGAIVGAVSGMAG